MLWPVMARGLPSWADGVTGGAFAPELGGLNCHVCLRFYLQIYEIKSLYLGHIAEF
jgi:hypothetical protein